MYKTNHVSNFIKTYQYSVFSFVAILSLFYGYILLMMKFQQPIYDSYYYMFTGQSVFQDGKFILEAYPETFRGCLYPILNAGLLCLERGLGLVRFTMVYFVNAVMGSVLITHTIPYLLGAKINSWKRFFSCVVFAIFVLVFWGDFISYTTSDFPAMVSSFFLLALMKAFIQKEQCLPFKICCALLVGALGYFSYNTRALFLAPFLLAIVYLIIVLIKKDVKKLALYLVGISLGAMLLAIPQMKINHNYTGKYTPRVLTEQLFNYESTLQMSQVFWGYKTSNYISNIGNREVFPNDALVINNAVGQLVLGDAEITEGNFTVGKYLETWMHYPAEMFTTYFNKLIVYLSPFSHYNAYQTEFYSNKIVVLMLNMFVVTLSFLSIWYSKPKKEDVMDIALPLISISTCLIMLLGACEIRFFMSFHFLMYGYLLFKADIPFICKSFLQKPIKNLLVLLVAYLGWVSCLSNILAEPGYPFLMLSAIKSTFLPAALLVLSYVSIFLVILGVLNYPAVKEYLVHHSQYKGWIYPIVGICVSLSILGVIDLGINQYNFARTYIYPHYDVLSTVCELDGVEAGGSSELQVYGEAVTLEPESIYRVSFDGRFQTVPSTFYCDFYGKNYDAPAQDMLFYPRAGKDHYEVIVKSDICPENVSFRIISISEQLYTLSNIKIEQVEANNKLIMR